MKYKVKNGVENMNVLEKILEEIRELKCNQDSKKQDYITGYMSALSTVEGIIAEENDGWIPVEAGLPEEGKRVLATVRHSNWISDFYSEWVTEEEKIHHPETEGVYLACINENGIWLFVDEDGQENICEEEFLTDPGRVYDVVTHWMPLPEPYKPKETPAAEHIMSRFTRVE